jgi:hypothetical protein
MLNTPKEFKSKIIEFVKSNDLDFDIVDSGISKFHINSYDGLTLFVYEYENKPLLVKYDKDKDKVDNPVSQAYEYFYFNNLNELLESLSAYDKSIVKNYWSFVASDIDLCVDMKKYSDDWYKDIINDSYKIQEETNYNWIYYESKDYKPQLKSPYNTLHEVSPLNPVPIFTTVEKLYFEIHPISCEEKSEKYLLKILSNNDDIFKEYINYFVYTKRGIKKLIENIFEEMKIFKK